MWIFTQMIPKQVTQNTQISLHLVSLGKPFFQVDKDNIFVLVPHPPISPVSPASILMGNRVSVLCLRFFKIYVWYRTPVLMLLRVLLLSLSTNKKGGSIDVLRINIIGIHRNVPVFCTLNHQLRWQKS